MLNLPNVHFPAQARKILNPHLSQGFLCLSIVWRVLRNQKNWKRTGRSKVFKTTPNQLGIENFLLQSSPDTLGGVLRWVIDDVGVYKYITYTNYIQTLHTLHTYMPYIHAYIHTLHTYIHTYIAYINTYIRTYLHYMHTLHTHMETYNTYIHTYMQACIHTTNELSTNDFVWIFSK